jgi:hypothetical protein
MLGPASDHELAEKRSLAYHGEIASRLSGDPDLLVRARSRVESWLSSAAVARFYAEQWRDLLGRPRAEIELALLDAGEPMRMLRQVSPFAGALPPRDRWRIWRTVRATP